MQVVNRSFLKHSFQTFINANHPSGFKCERMKKLL